MSGYALDSSVLMPSVHALLAEHATCRAELARATVVLQPVWVETFAALTRLPLGYSLTSGQALRAVRSTCPDTIVTLSGASFMRACDEIAAAGVSGGAMCDGFIGICARDNDITLITRDKRAIPTYSALGVDFEVVAH